MSKLGTMAGLAWVGPVSCVPLSMRETRAARVRTRTGCGVPRASASERNSICSVIVPADGTRAATAGKRRLRYVCVFWAALGQAAACLYLMKWGLGRKAQWPVEELNAEHVLGRSAARQFA